MGCFSGSSLRISLKALDGRRLFSTASVFCNAESDSEENSRDDRMHVIRGNLSNRRPAIILES